jgi:hypothetical protein
MSTFLQIYLWRITWRKVYVYLIGVLSVNYLEIMKRKTKLSYWNKKYPKIYISSNSSTLVEEIYFIRTEETMYLPVEETACGRNCQP